MRHRNLTNIIRMEVWMFGSEDILLLLHRVKIIRIILLIHEDKTHDNKARGYSFFAIY